MDQATRNRLARALIYDLKNDPFGRFRRPEPEARATRPVLGIDRTEYGLPLPEFFARRMSDFGKDGAGAVLAMPIGPKAPGPRAPVKITYDQGGRPHGTPPMPALRGHNKGPALDANTVPVDIKLPDGRSVTRNAPDKYTRALINHWQKDRPIGQREPATIPAETIDTLRNGPRQRPLDFDRPLERAMSFDDLAVGSGSGSYGPTPPAKPPASQGQKSNSLTPAKAVKLAELYDKKGGKIRLQDAKKLLPDIPAERLQKAIEAMRKAARPDRTMVELVDRVKIGGAGAIGAGAAASQMDEDARKRIMDGLR